MATACDDQKTIAKEQLGQVLQAGEHKQLWFAIPDSPGCWTIDLEDLPNLADKSGFRYR